MRWLPCIVLLLSAVPYVKASPCPSTSPWWCEVYNAANLSAPYSQPGWNNPIYVHATHTLFMAGSDVGASGNLCLFASCNPLTTNNGPNSNSFWHYQLLSSTITTTGNSPWTELTTGGDNNVTNAKGFSFSLYATITSGATNAEFCFRGSCGTQSINSTVNGIPQSCTSNTGASIPCAWFVGDEAMTYTSCDEILPTLTLGSCSIGTTVWRLNGLTRGVRTGAGWLPAYPHFGDSSSVSAGEPANMAAPNPLFNINNCTPAQIVASSCSIAGAASLDHPPSRHSRADLAYDSKRGRLIWSWGYSEGFSWSDTWYICVNAVAGGCTAGQVANTAAGGGWQRIPLYTCNNTVNITGITPVAGCQNPGSASVSGATQENSTVYDPVDDAVFAFGGLSGAVSQDIWAICFSSPTCVFGVTVQNKWTKINYAGHGNPGTRDGPSLMWDSVDGKIIAFGGLQSGSAAAGTAVYYNSVAIYTPSTGNWCISDVTDLASHSPAPTNASSCGSQYNSGSMTGTPPPKTQSSSVTPPTPGYLLRFATATYDGLRNRLTVWMFNDTAYLYNVTANAWTGVSLPSGPSCTSGGVVSAPCPQSNNASESYWVYDDVNDAYIYIFSFSQLWQLPGAALSAPGPIAGLSPGSLTFSSQLVGTTSAAQTITLTNNGTANLTWTTLVSLTGTNAADYAVSSNTCTSPLTPTSSCTVSITFTPSAAGSRVATVNFTDNAAGSPQTVGLIGTGSTSAIASLSPTTLTFSNQNVGTTSGSQAIILTNTGGASLTITSIVASGDFAQSNACPGTLTASSNCTINVTFTPTTTGSRTGAVTFTDSAAGSPQTVTLSGTGVVANPWATVRRGNTQKR